MGGGGGREHDGLDEVMVIEFGGVGVHGVI